MRSINSSAASTSKLNGATPHASTKPKAKVKPTMSSQAAQDIHDEIRAQAAEFSNDYMNCSARRKLVAWVASVVAGMSNCMLMATAFEILSAAAVVATTSTFLGVVITILGVAVTAYSTIMATSHAFAYVISSRPEQHLALVRNGVNSMTSKVRGWFSKGTDDEVIA